MPYTPEAKDQMLRALFNGRRAVGLMSGNREVRDAAYKRQEVQFGRPSGTDGRRQLENTQEVRFPPFDGLSLSVDGFIVFDGETEIVRQRIEAKPYQRGDSAIFHPGELFVSLED